MGAAFTIMGFNPKQRRIAFTELQSKFCVCVREAFERLALLHRLPLLFLPLAGVVLANSRINIALHDTF